MNNKLAIEAVITEKLCWPDQIPHTVAALVLLLDAKDKEIADLSRDRRRAEWAFENSTFQKVGDSYEISTEGCDYIRGSWREAVDDAMADTGVEA